MSIRCHRFVRFSELCVAVALPLFLFVVYVLSPTSGFWDARYAILTSETILEGDGFDLSRPLRGMPFHASAPGQRAPRLPWQLHRAKRRLLYAFPPGTPLLSLPLVASLRAMDISSLAHNGRYEPRSERRMQLLAASFVASLTALVILRLARREVSLLPATAIALLAGLGSSLWTIASRELWSHTWSAFLIGVAWLELLRWEEGEKPRPLWLGALASAAFWVRPSNAWIALALTAFVALRHRRRTPKLLASGALGLAAYFAWSRYLYSALLPTYVKMPRPWSLRTLPAVFVESLASTTHGLLVYSPILIAAAYLLLRHGIPASRRPLALLGSVLVLGHLILHAAAGAVWGPPGPRLQHDVVPILAWFGAVAMRGYLERDATAAAPRWRRRSAAALVAASLAAASVLASIGSIYSEPSNWGTLRVRPEAVDRGWDLRRLPQYLGVRALCSAAPKVTARREAASLPATTAR